MILGYRIWKVNIILGLLEPTAFSLNQGHPGAWYHSEVRARCPQTCRRSFHLDSTIPDLRCNCGFNAWKSAELLIDHITGKRGIIPFPRAFYHYQPSNFPQVFGLVSMWGKVIEHEEGYRAEYARVENIIYIKKDISESLLQRLKSNYPILFFRIDKVKDLAKGGEYDGIGETNKSNTRTKTRTYH